MSDKMYRVEVIETKDEHYPSKWIQLLYTYDGYFFGNLCGKKLLDVEVVPEEFLTTQEDWSSKFKNYMRRSCGGYIDDSLFNKDGCIYHDIIKDRLKD